MDTFLLSPEAAVQSKATAGINHPAQESSGDEFNPALEEAIAELDQETQFPVSNEPTEDALLIKQMEITEEIPAVTMKNLFTEGLAGSQNTQIQAKSQGQEHTDMIPAAKDHSPPVVSQEPSTIMAEEDAGLPVPCKPETSKAETLLLQQIQKILNEGKNEGSIVIKAGSAVTIPSKEHAEQLRSLSAPVLADAENGSTVQAKQNLIQPIMVEEKPHTGSSSPVKTESLRQGVTEQFLNAKFGDSEKDRNENSQQQSKQSGNQAQNNNGLQQILSTNNTNSATAEGANGESSFTQQLGTHSPGATSSVTTPVSIEGKFAPGANVPVAEQEIVDTLIQRFNVNPRLQTSKLTMQLHPAELGELKVNISVKENTLSASIVAQSQHVLETLEKNIPRLRAVLEGQGFTVDSFDISIKSDEGSQQQLFQEQFESKEQTSTANHRTVKDETESFDVLLEEQEVSENTMANTNGVNLTV